MIRKLLFALAWLAALSGMAHAAAVQSGQPNVALSNQPGGQYYCPPGAKYCPVPGRDNTVFLDTHFGVDANTGEMKRYEGNVHPNEVVNNLTTREEVLYNSPPVNVTNRQVPYPGAPAVAQTTMASAANQPAPQYVQARPAQVTKASEVADQRPVRQAKIDQQPVAEDKKIPWWKGGMWRNKKNPDEEEPKSASEKKSSAKAPAKSSSSAPAVSADDMWGDEEEYSGYGNDGSVNNQPRQPVAQQRSVPQQTDPYGDPFAAPAPAQQGQVYTQPAPTFSGTQYASDPYTLPNSPPPTSPYQQGYVYPGSDVTYENTYQGGYPQGAPPVTYQSDPYSTPAPMPQTQNYMPPPAPPPASGQASWDSQPQSGFAMPPSAPSAFTPPPPAPAASVSRGGSTQFDNAVRMVKESRFAEAKAILLGESTSDPNNPAVWRWLGDSQYNLLELQDALESYQNALRLDPNDYYALRGQGFANLHRGHELWRTMMEELNAGQRDQAAATFTQAHENYKRSLERLGECLRRAPNDEEAIYGEAMAAEGASRKLYSNAVSYIKLGPENRERAELFAENCLQVINKGVERASERSKSKPGESGPRALLGGLYLRKAMLFHQLGKKELALAELRNSYSVQKSILDEIDKNNLTAQKGVRDCETYWAEWGGTGKL